MVASKIGEMLGCNINEGGTDPCYINGIGWGNILSATFSLGWLMLMTMPSGIILFFMLTYNAVNDIRYHYWYVKKQ